MVKPLPEHAPGYVRVSTKRPADGGVGPVKQEERLAAHYAQLRMELVQIYRDDGLSSTTGDRPGLQAPIEHAMRRGSGITEIGVDGLSRLSRDHDLPAHYGRKLKQASVRIVAIIREVGPDPDIDLARTTGRIL